jgi:hypothetical protein
MGGKGVHVGACVGVRVMVGVIVMVGLAVGVLVSVVITADSTEPFELITKKIKTAPSVRKRANKTSAAGKLSVISGNLFARTSEEFLGVLLCSSLVPQTRHRVADSLRRVPQTGQSFVGEVFFSGLILFLD